MINVVSSNCSNDLEIEKFFHSIIEPVTFREKDTRGRLFIMQQTIAARAAPFPPFQEQYRRSNF